MTKLLPQTCREIESGLARLLDEVASIDGDYKNGDGEFEEV